MDSTHTLDNFTSCLSLVLAEVVPGWSRGGPGVVCHPHWAIPICKKSSSHSNIEHYKTSRTCTKTTLRITKRAGASPQQCCKSQSEQELYVSNIANYKTSRSFTTAMLQITKRAGAWPQQHGQHSDATGQFKRILHLTNSLTALKYINPVLRAGGKQCTNVEARGSQVRGG